MKDIKLLLMYLNTSTLDPHFNNFLPMAEKLLMDPPLGLWYLKAMAQRAGYRADVMDQRIHPINCEGLLNKIHNDGYAAVGFYNCAYGLMQKKVLQYVKDIKDKSNIFVMVGGPPTESEDLFNAGLDLKCHGEGELTLLEILEYLKGNRNISDVKGISYRRPNGTIDTTSPRELIEDLDDIPFPALDPSEIPFYGNMGIISNRRPTMVCMATRGCPMRCTYCTSHYHWGNKYRKRSTDNVVAELTHYRHSFGARFIHFRDDILCIDEKWFMDLCDKLIQARLGLHWICNIYPTLLEENTEEKLRKMKAAGCNTIHIGLQSASPEMLKRIKRKPEEPQILARKLKIAQKLGILTYVDFIFGLPGETEKTMEITRKWIMETRPHYLAIWALAKLEGSEIEREYGDKRVTELTDDQIEKGISRTKNQFFRNPIVLLKIFWFLLTKNPYFFFYAVKLIPAGLSLIGFKRLKKHW